MTLYLGILLALLCAATTNLAFLFKHKGACAAPDVCVRHPLRTAKDLWSSRFFAVGMLVGGAAWLLHVGAVSLAPLSVVQAVLSGGLVMLAVMADRLFGHRVKPRQWWGLALTATGLVLLGITLPTAGGDHSAFSLPAMIAFQGGLFAAGALLIMGPRIGGPAEHHGIMLAAAAGLTFGMGNIGIKALTGIAADDGALGLLVSPWTAVAVLASVTAFYCSARSLQKGEAVGVIAITGTIANTAAIAGGIVVFGDPMPSDALGIVAQALAFTLVIVASALTPGPVRAAGGVPGGGPAAAAGHA